MKLLLFRRRIRAKSMYNFEKKTLNIKGIKATIPNEKFPIEVGIGEITKENFPSSISEELKELDNFQVRIAETINSMDESPEKESKKKEYFDVLLKMLQIAQNKSSSVLPNKKKTFDKTTVNPYPFFNGAGYEIANINISDLDNTGLVIWPVTLQARPTIIHKAQIEIIRILIHKNWDLKIIIADCGTENVENKIHQFKRELITHLQKRDINFSRLELLSDYYKPDQNGGQILKKFTEISSKLKISELKIYNTKQDSYSLENKHIIENRITLKFIQPVLSWSVVITEAEKYYAEKNKKTIVIAGKDELKQWKYIFALSSIIGGIFHSILEDDSKNTIFQEEEPMIFHSEYQTIENLNKGNLAKWLFDSFVYTPNFPNKLENLEFCTECKRLDDCRNCIFFNNTNVKLPDFVDKTKFVSSFWNLINPT